MSLEAEFLQKLKEEEEQEQREQVQLLAEEKNEKLAQNILNKFTSSPKKKKKEKDRIKHNEPHTIIHNRCYLKGKDEKKSEILSQNFNLQRVPNILELVNKLPIDEKPIANWRREARKSKALTLVDPVYTPNDLNVSYLSMCL